MERHRPPIVNYTTLGEHLVNLPQLSRAAHFLGFKTAQWISATLLSSLLCVFCFIAKPYFDSACFDHSGIQQGSDSWDMDRYQKVEKPRPESAAISENEIRITSQGLIRNYVNYASSLLQVSSSSSSPLIFVCVEFGCAFGFLFSFFVGCICTSHSSLSFLDLGVVSEILTIFSGNLLHIVEMVGTFCGQFGVCSGWVWPSRYPS